VLSYTVSVPYSVSSITVTGVAADSLAAVSGGGRRELEEGDNTFTITVTAEDGVTTKIYTVVVTREARPLSTDATLSNLTVSEGELTPAFNPDATTYTVNVPNSVTSISVTGEAGDENATVAGNVADTTLEVGNTVIIITVTAEDGETAETYTVTVVRAAPSVDPPTPTPSTNATLTSLTVSAGTLTPTFNPDITTYTVNVPNSVTSISVTGTASDRSAIVEGNKTDMQLEVGSVEISIVVTAEDKETKRTYTVTVIRAAAQTAVTTVAEGVLQVYPNPVVNGVLNIANVGLKVGEKVKIYSLSGSLVATYEVATGSETAINVSQLPQGVYLVKVGASVARVAIY
jgi:hypothetical protein